MSGKYQIKVLNRKGDVLASFDSGVSGSTTVDEFKKLFLKECDYASKYTNQLYFLLSLYV